MALAKAVPVTWMAPMPTWDTRMPMHWVRPTASYIPTGRLFDGRISPGGWPSACGLIVSPVKQNGSRPVCADCAPVADYPYGKGPDD